MSRHTRPDDGDDTDDNEAQIYAPSIADVVTRWRYTLSPTTYVSDDSTIEEILWQQLLEQRAARHWLALIWWTLFWGILAIGVVIVAVNR